MSTTSTQSVDLRLKTLIENGSQLNHRSLFVVLGPNSSEQVMVIHHLVSKTLKDRPSILWCHKKGSDVPRQSRKQLKKLEKNLKSGKVDISSENAFHLFLLATPIKYCSYSDTRAVLGSTYGMCVLQDIEGFTPNVLCRVIETVRGGGVVVIISKEKSLRQFFCLEMDVHSKLKTHSHPAVTPLFNERFVLSLGWCKSCLILDDKLQVMKELPSLNSDIHPVTRSKLEEQEVAKRRLQELQTSLEDGEKPLPQLVACCKTVDQAKSVLKMIDVITDKGLRGTVSITAGRGRGKSAALGLSVAAAVHFGLNNIFVTSPTPENLGTFFEFIFKGFDALEYKENHDYVIIQSTNVEFNEAIVRVNVFREYRQTIQYIEPSDAKLLNQAELLVIDEAAAIPLPYVKALMGSCTVFMSSTINGYEGTGRSLSLKLLNQLRLQSTSLPENITSDASISSGPTLHEVTLHESIRYGNGDPVEKWLDQLLCLDATSSHTYSSTCPPPHNCLLYYVNRDVLLSGHEESEEFLLQVISLLVASHYRNSPDDLQVLSDAPAHHLFVLLSPVGPGLTSLPTVLAVIQVCLEGGINKKVADACKSRGDRPSGDLVPWCLATQFLDTSVTELLGVRIVRVATHPDYQSMGYGSRAISLLWDYYNGKHLTLDDEESPAPANLETDQQDFIVPRRNEKPLLSKLGERTPEEVDYLSVSYGITQQLFKFWKRAGFIPLYISQVANKITGEHNCVMVRPIGVENQATAVSIPDHVEWVIKPAQEFLRRFITLLAASLRDLPPMLALSVIQSHDGYIKHRDIEWNELQLMINGHDLQRIEKYAKNLADRNLIMDILHHMAFIFFMKRLPAVQLSLVQAGILLGLGLQMKTVDDMLKLMELPVESLLGQLNRAVRRFLKAMNEIQEVALARYLPSATTTVAEFTPVDITLATDLDEAAKDFEEDAKRKRKHDKKGPGLLGDLSKYAVQGDEATWVEALQKKQDVVTIKNPTKPQRLSAAALERELAGPPTKKIKPSHKSKKKNKYKPVN
ncbi:N-acetyltransferase 10 [Halocaridina rubra]|uniref:RNA cytidine acetyltransferase n=1 Tax=Halocaridina rubra TaxID=373956 RepID=A0AAN9A0T7_HALRR